MLTTFFLWKLTSTALYLKLYDFFILPSCSKLHNLLCQTTVETRVVDQQYLQQRSKDLTEQQRIVTLMIDEVYTAQRVEYSMVLLLLLQKQVYRQKPCLLLWYSQHVQSTKMLFASFH